jgi:putative heme-binding domain-containing protein
MSIRRLLIFAALLSMQVAGQPEEQEPKKSFFLPQNPVAAAYVLGRLSNKELTEAPRSEFVYVALLQRKGLDRKYRIEALEGLGKVRNTDFLTELIAGLGELDKKGEDSEAMLRDLLAILLQSKPEELAAKRAALEKLATNAQLSLTRQIASAALITGDASIERAWNEAESNPKHLADLILSIQWIRNGTLRASFYPKIQPLLQRADSLELRRAAITAIAALPGREAESFKILTGFMKAGIERAAVISSLQRIPKKLWPKENIEPLVNSLVNDLQKVAVTERTESDFVNAVQFATDLASLLPPEKAGLLHKTLRGMGMATFVIRTIYEQMLYDKLLIVVEAGKPVEIILQNEDAMPHNLVIAAPGALEEVGLASEKMLPEPDAQGRLYVPDSPKVLHATKMVDLGQQAKLTFTAPGELGEYPYLCTFPGHWRRMVGTMAVVEDVEAYLASRAASPEPTITEWKVEDLAPDLAKIGFGRNLDYGKQLFTRMACAQCHKLGKEGSSYGPDLTEVLKRWKGDHASVLTQIIEPSKVIDERYRNYEFELRNGDTLLGMIVREEAGSITVQTGPADALIQTIKKSDIKQQQPQPSSLMPVGLLNSLSREEIFDLLAYIESGGNLSPHEHEH